MVNYLWVRRDSFLIQYDWLSWKQQRPFTRCRDRPITSHKPLTCPFDMLSKGIGNTYGGLRKVTKGYPRIPILYDARATTPHKPLAALAQPIKKAIALLSARSFSRLPFRPVFWSPRPSPCPCLLALRRLLQ